MISAIKLKKRVADVGIPSVVIDKLRYKKKPCPIILLKVDKGLEISFHCTILSLRLAVRLRVEGDGEFPLNIKEIA